MNIRTSISKLVFLLAASSASLVAMGATPGGSDSKEQQQSSPQGMMGQRMMGGDMTEMMRSCQSMMGGSAGTSAMTPPKLPPGNEKLEAQMHAEMMQKIGEIAARYVERSK